MYKIPTVGICLAIIHEADSVPYSTCCNVGLLSRGERVVLMGLGLLINQVPPVLLILTFFSYVTAAQRLWQVKKATEGDTASS